MKLLSISIFIIYSMLGFTQESTLTINVSNFEEHRGQLIISIFDNPENFPNKGAEIKRIFVDELDYELTSVEVDLPKGTYAIALLHDLNLDDKCNFNFIGIPVEAYGFSQNVRPIIKVPNFEETMFQVAGDTSINISLIQ